MNTIGFPFRDRMANRLTCTGASRTPGSRSIGKPTNIVDPNDITPFVC